MQASEVRLIDEQNNQLGILSRSAALKVATDRGLDLVEVSGQASPPVCRLMDYGRFRFDSLKKERDARRRQSNARLKEMKLRPKVAAHDFGTKVKRVREFVTENREKVKVTIMFRGREVAHQEIGVRLLDKVASELKDVAVVERPPTMEGRSMFMILAPGQQAAKAPAPAPAPALPAAEA